MIHYIVISSYEYFDKTNTEFDIINVEVISQNIV